MWLDLTKAGFHTHNGKADFSLPLDFYSRFVVSDNLEAKIYVSKSLLNVWNNAKLKNACCEGKTYYHVLKILT